MADEIAKGRSSTKYGLVSAIAYPPTTELRHAYQVFRHNYSSAWERRRTLSSEDYLAYSATSLHCTVATLHSFDSCLPSHIEGTALFWKERLVDAMSLPEWPRHGCIKVVGARLDPKGCGYLILDDVDRCVQGMRSCLSRCLNQEISQNKSIAPNKADIVSTFRVPNIVHMTVLRWRRDVKFISAEDFQSHADDFQKSCTEDCCIQIPVRQLSLLQEVSPYMRQTEILSTYDLRSD